MTLRYAYFPGCSAKGTCGELDISTKAVADLFGIELNELRDPGCTGARHFRVIDESLHLLANGRILALAEAESCDLVVVCDTCLLNLTEANQRLKADANALERVNAALSESGLEYRGSVTVKHFLWVLMGDIGEERIREKVVRPLSGLKVACFYGCHMLRPATAFGSGLTENASSLERLCALLGAETVAYEGSRKCCGFHVVLAEEKIAERMSGAHLAEASAQGAHCMVTPCPLCHTMLDAFQPKIEHALERSFGIPVLHASQLLGLAAGLPPDVLALSRHVVGAREILAMLPR